MTTRPTARDSYHHGNLRAELVAAGVDLCREGGPHAVALREVSRRVGVVPNAVYAHFATLTDLRIAVADRALELMGAAITDHLAGLPADPDPRSAALARLRTVGRGYVLFALDEPGLFRAAMQDHPAGPGVDAVIAGADQPGVVKPSTHLRDALGALAASGWAAPERLGDAAAASWAMVHGLASLMLRDPDAYDAARREAMIGACLDVLLAGLEQLRS